MRELSSSGIEATMQLSELETSRRKILLVEMRQQSHERSKCLGLATWERCKSRK